MEAKFRFKEWGEFTNFLSYTNALIQRRKAQAQGVTVGPVEVNCPFHGWTLIVRGECALCRSKRLWG